MGAFAILLPMDKAKFHSKVAELDQQNLPEAVQLALADPRNVDVSYTVFDIITKAGSTFKLEVAITLCSSFRNPA